MRLLVMSDLHLEFAQFEIAGAPDFDVAVLAGDIHRPGEFGVRWAELSGALQTKPVIIVPGNHEFYGTRMDLELEAMRDAACGTRIQVLDQGEVVIERVRFLGATLWTDFSLAIETPHGKNVDAIHAARLVEAALNDFRLIRVPDERAVSGTWTAPRGRDLCAQDTLMIHLAQREWLRERLQTPFDGKTVVVTHHAPNRGSLAPQYASDWISAGFVSDLPDEFFDVPVLWVHGHTHTSFDYQVGGCRIVCNPRGYVRTSGAIENNSFDPALVVTI